jgi:hypothetical protein
MWAASNGGSSATGANTRASATAIAEDAIYRNVRYP